MIATIHNSHTILIKIIYMQGIQIYLIRITWILIHSHTGQILGKNACGASCGERYLSHNTLCIASTVSPFFWPARLSFGFLKWRASITLYFDHVGGWFGARVPFHLRLMSFGSLNLEGGTTFNIDRIRQLLIGIDLLIRKKGAFIIVFSVFEHTPKSKALETHRICMEW